MIANEKVEINDSLIYTQFCKSTASHTPVTPTSRVLLVFSLLCLSEIPGIVELDEKLNCPFDREQCLLISCVGLMLGARLNTWDTVVRSATPSEEWSLLGSVNAYQSSHLPFFPGKAKGLISFLEWMILLKRSCTSFSHTCFLFSFPQWKFISLT